MLHLVCGDDVEKAERKFRTLVLGATDKGDHLIRVNAEDSVVETLQEQLASQTLLTARCVVAVREALDIAEVLSFVEEKLHHIVTSDHTFIFLEADPSKKLISSVERAEGETHCFTIPKEKKEVMAREEKEKFRRVFVLTDALGRRDRKGLWVGYQKMLLKGVSAEEIFWKFWWMVKNLALATESGNAKEAGLNPFVFNKTKKFAEAFSPKEIQEKARGLVSVWHDAHQGRNDFPLALEQFILGV